MTIGSHDTTKIPHASEIERKIVGQLVADLLTAGFSLSINDGEDETVTDSTDVEILFPALSSTDCDSLYVLKDGKQFGWIYLVWGNDDAVISDYTTNLETHLATANAIAEGEYEALIAPRLTGQDAIDADRDHARDLRKNGE